MSGIASIILTVLGAANKWKQIPRSALWSAAAVCFFVAAARVWTSEHAKVQSQITYVEIDPTLGFKSIPAAQLPLFKTGAQSIINIRVSNIGAYRADNEYNPLHLEIHNVDPTFDPYDGLGTNHVPSSPEIEKQVFNRFRARQLTWRLPRIVIFPGKGGFTEASTDHPLSETEVEALRSEKKIMYLVGFTKWDDGAGTHERRFCYFIQPPADTTPFIYHTCYTHNDFFAKAED